MNILIVEDDPNKYNHILEHIQSEYAGINIDTRYSYQSGLRSILINEYDLVILDMSLPTYDISLPEEPGGPFRDFAGEEILYELRCLGVKRNIVIITQFESFGVDETYITLSELKTKLETEFPDNYLGSIYYNAFETNWKFELTNILNKTIREGIC